MNAVTKTRPGHWADQKRHSDMQEGPIERFLEFDEEARRRGKLNAPTLGASMGAIVPLMGLFALLLVAVCSAVVQLLSA